MSRVFIVGGAGFIGASLTRQLLAEGDEVLLYDAFINFIDPLHSRYEEMLAHRLKDIREKATLVRGDIRSQVHLIRNMKEFKPDVVVNLAAIPIAKTANQYPEETFGINLEGTFNILEAMRKATGVKRFVYASSSMVYGNFQKPAADEEHPTNPIEIYGGTKLAGEVLTKSYGRRFGIEYTIVRPSAVYGPTDPNRRVSQIFLQNAMNGKPLRLDGGGQTKLDFTYVEDIAQGLLLAAKREKAADETFNITYGQARSLKDFAELLAELIPGVKTEVAPVDTERPERGTLDISKAKRLLGYEPQYPLEKGLMEYVKFAKDTGIY